jgi:hypothetical protein
LGTIILYNLNIFWEKEKRKKKKEEKEEIEAT